jgi:hypothetical protein
MILWAWIRNPDPRGRRRKLGENSTGIWVICLEFIKNYLQTTGLYEKVLPNISRFFVFISIFVTKFVRILSRITMKCLIRIEVNP